MAICNPIIDPNCNSASGYKADIVTNSVTRGSKFLSGTITALLAVGVLYFIYTFIMAGISFISSNGDEKQLTAAKGKIMGALIGLVVMFAVFAILAFFGNILGIDLIKLNLPTLT